MFGLVRINDITTTFPNPPEFQEIRKIETKRNFEYRSEFAPLQRGNYDLSPLPMTLSPDEAYKRVEQKLLETGWKIISRDPALRKFEAVDTTALMRFKDDIVIEIRDNNKGSMGKSTADEVAKSWVHMRSKSRLGRSDLGKNYQRIEAFFTRIQEK